MGTSIDTYSELKKILHTKFPEHAVNEQVINFLFSSKIIEHKTILRALVKNKYFELLKAGSSARSATLDCAIEFNVSQGYVRKMIYRHTNIRV